MGYVARHVPNGLWRNKPGWRRLVEFLQKLKKDVGQMQAEQQGGEVNGKGVMKWDPIISGVTFLYPIYINGFTKMGKWG